MEVFDLAIAGGGASGLFCAVRAAGRGKRVVLLEASDRVGKKLLSTGNGQGNLTNADLRPERYHGSAPEFCVPALAAFDNRAAREAFSALGLLTEADGEGRVYPVTRQAGSVVDLLRLAAEAAGVWIRTGFPAAEALKQNGLFEISGPEGRVRAKNLLLATGGMAAPTSKGFEAGYRIARAFGHAVTPLCPSLVQLKGDVSDCRVLKGVRCDVRLTLADGARQDFSGVGEILFCDYGISGKIVFEASSRVAGRDFSGMRAEIDFAPRLSGPELADLLAARTKSLPRLPADQLLLGVAKSQVARAVLARAALPRRELLSERSRPECERVAELLKRFVIPLTGPHSFDLAQVTHGGVRTEEVDPETMMSRLVPGLYFSGEILDVDGDCGGFNLQWCWSSAEAVARSLSEARP